MTTWTSDMRHVHAQILACPEADLPRLQFAELLDERDEPGDADRAEFIRKQISLANGDLKCKRRDRRCGRCQACHAESWAFVHSLGFGDRRWHTTTRRDTGVVAYVMTYERGFVAEIRLPLAAFVGGRPCGDCLGTGRDRVPYGEKCDRCKGTKCVPGHAAAIFKAHPVTRVVLSDREPEEDGSFWIWWDRGNGIDAEENVPTEIYDLMPGYSIADWGDWRKMHPTRAAALDALFNVAAVAYGREQAGLPPI